jgi:hypothetical protein
VDFSVFFRNLVAEIVQRGLDVVQIDHWLSFMLNLFFAET